MIRKENRPFDSDHQRIISVTCNFNKQKILFDCFEGDYQTDVLRRGKIWESHIIEFILANGTADRPFFDIGANIGFHSIMCQIFSKKIQSIVAVEPHPTIFKVLKKNRTQNNCNFHVVQAACWDATGVVEMKTELGKDTGDTFVNAGDVRVPTILIDDLAEKFGHPKIIKMDIQGFEANAILGAARTISKGNIDIIVEFHPK